MLCTCDPQQSLDPAKKSVRFRGFASDSVQVCVETIEKIIRDLGSGICSCEHIYKGPVGSRILTDMCVVELTSNSIRERILKDVQGKPFQDPSRAELAIDRAKTAFQLQRNNYLRKVSDALKKEPTCKDKPVVIVWQQEDRKDKDRTVTVGNDVAFRQSVEDMHGQFVSPFSCSV